jgi:hypothetical protein
MHRRCQWLVVEGCRDDGVGVGAMDDCVGALARNLPETALHASSRCPTFPLLEAPSHLRGCVATWGAA